MVRNILPTEYWWINRLNITDFWKGHDTSKTSDNKCTQLILLRLYLSEKCYNISFDILNKNTDSQAATAVSRDCSKNGLMFEPRTLRPLLGDNLRNLCDLWADQKRIQKRVMEQLLAQMQLTTQTRPILSGFVLCFIIVVKIENRERV